MFRFDQLIRRDMIIRDVKQRHPATIPVFEESTLSGGVRRLRYRNRGAQERARRPGRGGRAQCRRVRTQSRTPKKMQATTKPTRRKLHPQRNQPLDVFFSPKTVAVIGATENPGSVGRTLLWNLSPARSAARSFRSTPSGPASWASRPTPPSRTSPSRSTWP